MKFVNALGLVLGVIGGVLAFLALGPAHGVFFIWATPLAATLGLPAWAGIVVGATTSLPAISANLPIFPAIPSTVVGYASTFAYLLSTPGQMDNKVLLGMGLDNPLFVMVVSIVVAAGFGIFSLNLTGKLTKPAAA